MLRINPLSRQPSIQVRALFPSLGEDRGVLCWADGRRTLVRSRIAAGRRHLDTFTLPHLQPVDRIAFRLDDSGLTEERRQDREGGPNLLVHPLVLPERLQIDQPVYTSAADAVQITLTFAGMARLTLGNRQAERVVACLEARQGSTHRHLWLVAGVGEVAIGVPGEPFERWLEAWSGPDGPLLASVPSAWRNCDLPPLPHGPSSAPTVDGIG